MCKMLYKGYALFTLIHMSVENVKNVNESGKNLVIETPKTRLKPIVRKRINFLCSHCNKIFQSIATTRAKCPLCAASCSIKVSSESPEKYEKMGESDNSAENIEFEPSFISENNNKIESNSIIARKVSENSYELENRKILQLKTDNFKDYIELFNAGATIKGIKPISENELLDTFTIINNFLKENKIFEGIGKTGAIDIVFKITNLILDRLIPWLIERERNKDNKKNNKIDNKDDTKNEKTA